MNFLFVYPPNTYYFVIRLRFYSCLLCSNLRRPFDYHFLFYWRSVLVRVTRSIRGGVAELSARCYKRRPIALAIISIVSIGEKVNKFSFRLSTQYLLLRYSPPLLFLLALLKPAETVRFPCSNCWKWYKNARLLSGLLYIFSK